MKTIIQKNFNIGYIYKIENKVNGKVYIGQTIHPKERPFKHLNKPSSTNKRFSSSIKHYGKDNFEVKILCECYTKEDLNLAEIFYIVEWYDSTHYSRGYNLKTELQNCHFTNSLTKEEYEDFCNKMKMVQNRPEVNIKRSKSISDTKQSIYWKQYKKPSITIPNYSEKMSVIQKRIKSNPEERKKLSESQKLSYINNPERRLKQSMNGMGRFEKLTEEQKENIRNKAKINISVSHNNLEYKNKAIQKSIESRSTKEYKEKHILSHNTNECKRKVREAQIHPLRKFIEEHWFVIKDKYSDSFNCYEFCKRFCLDYNDSSIRQACSTGFKTLIDNRILIINGHYSFSSKGRCLKYKWLL